jgi:hypothetical protein
MPWMLRFPPNKKGKLDEPINHKNRLKKRSLPFLRMILKISFLELIKTQI